MSATTGSKGHGLRQGPILFQTTAQTGCVPPVISGFSGHFPGKQGANVIGATFDKSYTESLSHTISLGKTGRATVVAAASPWRAPVE
eukprot:g17552.t1